MIQDTITKIEARIRLADSLKHENKKELLDLLATLKDEMTEVAKTHSEQAHSIASFTAISAHEATREAPDPRLVKLSIEGLSTSVQGFEHSHPRLVQIVNAISTTLSNLGI